MDGRATDMKSKPSDQIKISKERLPTTHDEPKTSNGTKGKKGEHDSGAKYNSAQGSNRHGRHGVNSRQSYKKQKMATVAKEIYVGNIPHGSNEEGVKAFFTDSLTKIEGKELGGSPVKACRLFPVQMRSEKKTSNIITLDKIVYKRAQLKIKRPHGYDKNKAEKYGVQVEPSSNLNLGAVGRIPTVHKSPHTIYIRRIPYHASESQIREVLESIGRIKYFKLISKANGESKGYAFCDFEDHADSDKAIMALNGLRCGKLFLMVRKANQMRFPH